MGPLRIGPCMLNAWNNTSQRMVLHGSNQAQAEQRRGILLGVCGPTSYLLIRGLS